MEKELLALRTYISRFIAMSDADWQLLVPHVFEKQMSRNECLVKEGQRSNEICFLLDGDMRHYYTKEGEERTTYFYFENNLVADYIGCITKTPSRLSIEALTDCRLLCFTYTVLENLFKQSHTWEKFGRLIAEYLAIGLEERMVGLLMYGPEERYRQLLESNKSKILQRIPQQYIASYLGITPVSLSRIRNRFQKNR
jgi:CRP-like cAMP-binding protein